MHDERGDRWCPLEAGVRCSTLVHERACGPDVALSQADDGAQGRHHHVDTGRGGGRDRRRVGQQRFGGLEVRVRLAEASNTQLQRSDRPPLAGSAAVRVHLGCRRHEVCEAMAPEGRAHDGLQRSEGLRIAAERGGIGALDDVTEEVGAVGAAFEQVEPGTGRGKHRRAFEIAHGEAVQPPHQQRRLAPLVQRQHRRGKVPGRRIEVVACERMLDRGLVHAVGRVVGGRLGVDGGGCSGFPPVQVCSQVLA